MKKVLIISTSMRIHGNSDRLADEFMKGAVDGGHQVEKITLANKDIQYCRGCLTCQKTHQCIIKDDTNEIVTKMMNADVVVFATPIYFYEMCGQMKTLLDRTNMGFASDYNFSEIYLIATCADDDENAFDGCVTGLSGWIQCFDKATLKGVIKGVDVTEVGDVLGKEQLLQEAYIVGKNI